MIERHFPGPGSPRVYWLLSRRGRAHEIFFVLGGGGSGYGKALPVFTAERLAATFLEASGLDAAWRSRRVAGGELISLLCGPCGRVVGVSLDPLGESAVAGIEPRPDVSRVSFLDMLSGRNRRVEEGGRPLIAPGLGRGALVGA